MTPKTTMKVRTSLALLGMALLLISCDKKGVFDEYKSVGNAWHKDSIVSFDLPKMDSSKKYNLFLNIRDNKDFPFDNLFLIVSMEQPNHKVNVDTLEFKKFVIADVLALIALNDTNATQVTSTFWMWVIVYAYAFQIYFDFSGYTDIALGIAQLLGIKLPENFASPYLKPIRLS